MTKIKGIDNIFFEVANLNRAIAFYQQLGFKQKLAIPQIKAMLLSIGEEEPGLILLEKQPVVPSKLWVEVIDASQVKKHCSTIDVEGTEIETATGKTFEVVDESGNVIGFADYTKKPELARGDKEELAKEIAETYARRVWDNKDLAAIDELLHPKCVIHSLLGDFYGPESMKKVVQVWLTGFPDLIVRNTSIISEKGLVMIQWHAEGSHQGEFKGIKPTSKSVSYSGVTIYRISQAKIVDYWAYLDMQHLLKQIS